MTGTAEWILSEIWRQILAMESRMQTPRKIYMDTATFDLLGQYLADGIIFQSSKGPDPRGPESKIYGLPIRVHDDFDVPVVR